ncbi:MAG: GrpB family protein [Mycobacteriales bacterium]
MPQRRVTTSSIDLSEADAAWPSTFETERTRIAAALATPTRIEHIGSTAVPGLAAKNTVDILVVLAGPDDFASAIDALAAIGYDHRPASFADRPRHEFLRKVAGGRRTHHLHLLTVDAPEVDDYLGLRDYLRVHAGAVRRYAAVKRDLAAKDAHPEDRTRYIDGKADVVRELLAAARAWRVRRPAG